MLRANLKWNLAARSIGSYLALLIIMTGIVSCDRAVAIPDRLSAIAAPNPALSNTDGPLSEVNVPESISQLAPSLAKLQPQVQILSPKPDEILTDDLVTVKLRVTDFPLFKQPALDLGNHLQIVLDKQTYQSVYDLSQPLVFKNLAAGTHTLRVFASSPWHESFKNPGAFALVTFHVLTKTAENNPDPRQPLLTYSSPTGIYGAEPILLDYHLTNPPSQLASGETLAAVADWRIRVTVNEQRFILGRQAAANDNRSVPIYLQGFRQGKNWVRLELIDDRGNPIPNAYNDTVEIFTYQPDAKDPLSRLVRGEIDPNLAMTLVDPERIAIAPTLIPIPTPTPSVTPTPTPIPAPSVTTPTQIVKPSPSPIAIIPPIIIQPSPIPAPSIKPSPTPTATVPLPIAKPNPIPVAIVPPIVIQPSPSPSVKILPLPDLAVVRAPKLAPPNVRPSMAPSPAAGTAIGNPEPELQVQRPVPIVKPIPVKIVPPTIAKSIDSDERSTIAPVPTLATKPLPSSVPTGKQSPNVTVLILPQTVIEELIKPSSHTPNGTSSAATAISLPQSVVDELIEISARQQQQAAPAIVATPAAPATQIDNRPQTTWQKQAIELFDVVRVKIRAFTNTIPAKAQRFGQNMRAWLGETIDKLRQDS